MKNEKQNLIVLKPTISFLLLLFIMWTANLTTVKQLVIRSDFCAELVAKQQLVPQQLLMQTSTQQSSLNEPMMEPLL